MCTETEYCEKAQIALLTEIDLYEGPKGRCDYEITQNKQDIYREMISRGDAIVNPTTGHAELHGVKWTSTQTEAEYVAKFGI